MSGLFSTALTRCFSPSSVNKAAVFLSLQAHSSHRHTKKNSVQTWQKTKALQEKKKKKKENDFSFRKSKTYLSVADSRGQQKQRGDTSRQHLDADKQKRRKQKVRFSEERHDDGESLTRPASSRRRKLETKKKKSFFQRFNVTIFAEGELDSELGGRELLVWVFVRTEASRRSAIARNLRSAEEFVPVRQSLLLLRHRPANEKVWRKWRTRRRRRWTRESMCVLRVEP